MRICAFLASQKKQLWPRADDQLSLQVTIRKDRFPRFLVADFNTRTVEDLII